MKTILTIILVILTQNFAFTEANERFSDNDIEKYLKALRYEKNYQETIEFIKLHEGFSDKPYICPGGYKTIGYGHLIKSGEIFSELSKLQADSLLKNDFNNAIIDTEKYTKLEESKKLAIAHFIFCRGIGTYLKSTLKKRIDRNQPIESEILRFCLYRDKNKNLIFSKNSLKMRIFEIEMFYK